MSSLMQALLRAETLLLGMATPLSVEEPEAAARVEELARQLEAARHEHDLAVARRLEREEFEKAVTEASSQYGVGRDAFEAAVRARVEALRGVGLLAGVAVTPYSSSPRPLPRPVAPVRVVPRHEPRPDLSARPDEDPATSRVEAVPPVHVDTPPAPVPPRPVVETPAPEVAASPSAPLGSDVTVRTGQDALPGDLLGAGGSGETTGLGTGSPSPSAGPAPVMAERSLDEPGTPRVDGGGLSSTPAGRVRRARTAPPRSTTPEPVPADPETSPDPVRTETAPPEDRVPRDAGEPDDGSPPATVNARDLDDEKVPGDQDVYQGMVTGFDDDDEAGGMRDPDDMTFGEPDVVVPANTPAPSPVRQGAEATRPHPLDEPFIPSFLSPDED